MATRMGDDGMAETCSQCGRETAHDVCIQLRTESRKQENAEFSREPYRVATCLVCGSEESVRMNNA